METNLSLFCRWCSKRFDSFSSRYKHETRFHVHEKKANAEKFHVPDINHFVKCNVCSIYTSRDLLSIAAHKTSHHHTCAQSSAQEQEESETRSSSSTFRSVAATLPHRAHEVLSAYPRLKPQETLHGAAAAATVAPASGASISAAAAAVAAAASEAETGPEVAPESTVAASAAAALVTTEPAANIEASTPTSAAAAMGASAVLADPDSYIADEPDYRYSNGNSIFLFST